MEKNIIVLFVFWLLVLFFSYKEIKASNKLNTPADKKLMWWTQIILIMGILVRTVYLQYPFGMHLDEAINGYETWCLAHYGVDQHLNSYPVYFKSWGSGQSTLYAYLSIPFAKLFGTTTSTHRLVMAITSSISLLAFYYTLRKTQQDKFFILIAILFLAINPWHIMKSRWALDCNLSPDMILIAVCFFILGYYTAKSRLRNLHYVLGSIFLVLAAYSYGINWFMLPIFCMLLTIFLYKKEKITWGQIALYVSAMLVFLLPLMLFALLLATGADTYKIGEMSIVQLDSSRHTMTTVFGSTEPWGMFTHYMKRAAILLILGDDRLAWNSFIGFGQFYNILGLPFIFISLRDLYKKKNTTPIDALFLIWLIAMIPILLFVEPNVNHWNALWFPLIYFCAKGIYLVISKNALTKRIGIAMLCILALAFGTKYAMAYNKPVGTYEGNESIKTVVKFANTLDVDMIYNPGISSALTLFYAPISPYEYNATVVKSTKVFENVKQYSHNRFELPKIITPTPRTAYIVLNADRSKYTIDETQFKKWDEGTFSVFWNE